MKENYKWEGEKEKEEGNWGNAIAIIDGYCDKRRCQQLVALVGLVDEGEAGSGPCHRCPEAREEGKERKRRRGVIIVTCSSSFLGVSKNCSQKIPVYYDIMRCRMGRCDGHSVE